MKRIFNSLTQAGRAVGNSALVLAMLAVPISLSAQTVTLFGTLGNFDVLNDTGQDAHGFEIEIQGVPSNVMPYTFDWTRYGAAKKYAIPGGVLVRWSSPYDAASQQFTVATTTPAVFAPTYGHSCVLTQIAGCDHYGLGVAASKTLMYWLIADPNNPGQLIRFGGPQVQIPFPTVQIFPPAQVGLPPQVVFEVVAPVPPPPPIPKPVPQHGDATWVKVFKTELQREVNLEELVADNLIVPQDVAFAETAWKLLQFNPTSNGNSGVLRNQGGLNSGSRSVLRRYETYKFTGAYDPIDHGAICADGTCSAPAPDEVGDFIGAQNAAANVGAPSVKVTVVGDGQVSSDNGVIRCPTTCATFVDAGTVVTLTARNGKGIFSGWTGACVGISLTCTITVNEVYATTATFLTPYKLDLRTTGLGTATSNLPGTTFLDGTVVTLTAAPAAGSTFTGWSGACAGTAVSCTLTIKANTAVTANFSGTVAAGGGGASTSYKISVSTNGKGTVTTNPTGVSFPQGSSVTLTATPAVGSPWVGWGGACSGTAPTCTVTMNSNLSVTANFR